MRENQPYPLVLACIALILAVMTCGCTSSGSDSDSSDSGSGAADPHEFPSSFAELAGTYVSADDPSSSIVLDPTGAARVVAGGSQSDTSVYMEMDVLYLADGTSLGPYPVQDDTLVYQGVQYRKQS
jgi:ABC-type Fe3+-hydroxamate transport system substrate-binding protein